MGKAKTANENPDDKKPAKLDEELIEAKRDAMVEAREKFLEMAHDVTVLRYTVEMICEMQSLNAKLKWNWYSQLREAGFDDSQAIHILLSE